MIVLGIDVGIDSMGYCLLSVPVHAPEKKRKIPFVTEATVIYAGTICVDPFSFPPGTTCAGKTKKGKVCGRKVSHAKLKQSEVIATCPGHAKEFGCRIMSGARLRPGSIFEQLTQKFGEIRSLVPENEIIKLVVIESQPKMSNMFPIQYSVEIAAHMTFPEAAIAFFPSTHKLKQLGIEAPRGKRKHTQRKGLADKAIRDAIENGSVECSNVLVTIDSEKIAKSKKYDDIADALVVAVSAAKRIAPSLVQAAPLFENTDYSAYSLSGLL